MRDRQVLVLAIGAFLVMTGLTVVAPILPLYAREFGVGRAAAGVLISSFAVARLAFDVVGGVLADRFGARRVMTAGALLLAASSVGAALAPTYGLLLVTRVLEGIGSAAYATSANQLVVLITSRERLGRAMALYHTGILAGIAVGPIIGGYAAEIGDLKTPFWVYAALGLVVAGFVRWLIADVPTAGATMRPDLPGCQVGDAGSSLQSAHVRHLRHLRDARWRPYHADPAVRRRFARSR